MSTKHETDFYKWTQEEAAKLRSGNVNELDLENLAEEIEDMSGSQRRELFRRLRNILHHLLKWEFQPTRRGTSWRATLRIQRSDLNRLLRDSPSLRTRITDELPEAYIDAVTLAACDTGLAESGFPEFCPYPPELILDESFLPGPVQAEGPPSIHRSSRR